MKKIEYTDCLIIVFVITIFVLFVYLPEKLEGWSKSNNKIEEVQK